MNPLGGKTVLIIILIDCVAVLCDCVAWFCFLQCCSSTALIRISETLMANQLWTLQTLLLRPSSPVRHTHTHICFTVINNTNSLMNRHANAHRVCFCSMQYASIARACCVSAVYHNALLSSLKNEPKAIYSHVSTVY